MDFEFEGIKNRIIRGMKKIKYKTPSINGNVKSEKILGIKDKFKLSLIELTNRKDKKANGGIEIRKFTICGLDFPLEK